MVLSNSFSPALAVPFVRRRCEHLDRNLKAAARSREKGRAWQVFCEMHNKMSKCVFPLFLGGGGVVACRIEISFPNIRT